MNKYWSRKLAQKTKAKVSYGALVFLGGLNIFFGPVWVIGWTGPEIYHLIFQHFWLINKNWSRKFSPKKSQSSVCVFLCSLGWNNFFGPVWVIRKTGPETYHLMFQNLGLINTNWSRKLTKKNEDNQKSTFFHSWI